MQLITVESSMVRAVGYEEETRELEVVFHNGRVYRYVDVEKEKYEQLLKADSIGRYMRSNIIGMYGEYKVTRRGRR